MLKPTVYIELHPRQIAKMVLQTEQHHMALKFLLAENKAIRKSNTELNVELNRAKADLDKISEEKTAAQEQVRQQSAIITTLQEEAVALRNDLSLLSFEKAQLEGALRVACDLRVLEEGESENLKKMGELDRGVIQ